MTITYEQDGTLGAANPGTGAIIGKFALVTRVDTNAFSNIVTNSSPSSNFYTWSTEADNPNVADWPSGAYDGNLEISAISSGVSVWAVVRRVDLSNTSQEIIGSSATFTTAGTHNFSFSTDPSSGSISDRYMVQVFNANSNSHGNHSFTLEVNTITAFIRGPWTFVETIEADKWHPKIEEPFPKPFEVVSYCKGMA